MFCFANTSQVDQSVKLSFSVGSAKSSNSVPISQVLLSEHF